MSGSWIPYQTIAGDRWDLIAWRMYGDAWGFERLIAANPHVAITPVLEGGITLRIPLLAPVELAATDLPPWKR